jgi:hypothetical protein
MKLFLCTLLLLTGVFTIKLDCPQAVTFNRMDNVFTLRSNGSVGSTTYAVNQLPYGLILQGNQIKISGNYAMNGAYSTQVIVTDSQNNTDKSIVIININCSLNN